MDPSEPSFLALVAKDEAAGYAECSIPCIVLHESWTHKDGEAEADHIIGHKNLI